MLRAATPTAAFGLFLACTVSACAPIPELPPDRVTVLFGKMYVGKYDDMWFPDLGWEDIPALLARADSTRELANFPVNPASSLHQPTCPEGVVAVWLVEGIRKGGRFASLNPRPFPLEDPTKERAANVQALAQAYRGWWDRVKQMPPEQAREADPLGGTSFRWH
ncbi:MAG TPA: DUF4943 family protein [Urbifossiella sp.]|jgi:hypothetical protein|nr:DUF4943 family protein [Urbifossiella sp.]